MDFVRSYFFINEDLSSLNTFFIKLRFTLSSQFNLDKKRVQLLRVSFIKKQLLTKFIFKRGLFMYYIIT